MKPAIPVYLCLIFLSSNLFAAGNVPLWVTDMHSAFPDREWLSVVRSAGTVDTARSSAFGDLAAMFRVDIKSLETSSRQYARFMAETPGKKIAGFEESSAFAREVNTESDISGLIGIQTDVYSAPNGTVYVNARMNRRECSARYSGIIRENARVIAALEKEAENKPASFDAYAALNFAVVIAAATDDFQSILEILDPSAVRRRPGYGGVNAVKQLRQKCAQGITIGLNITAQGTEESLILTRAFGALFGELGFRTNDNGNGAYILIADILIERTTVSGAGPKACRYYLNAALADTDGVEVFSFSGNQRQNHNNIEEAYRRALRAVEESIKNGQFAKEFSEYLNSLIG
jgi:hypothetical protein